MDPGELQMVREVVRPKTPRGDGNWIALTGLALILVVVRPKTPRGDGNSTSISLTSPGEKITSSDPKPRERTETRRRSRRCRCPNRRVVRPKTPRGDGNLQHHHHPAPQLSMSSDPKPREGTETLRRRIRDLFPRIGRQTQNPERGRKLPRRLAITTPTNGRQTQNPERGRKPAKYRLHDTTTTRRQTQNPERGRKLLTMRLPRALFQPSSDPKPREGTETGSRQTGSRRSSPVVRPKTPRGDGNSGSRSATTAPCQSSDPKPREGTETFAKSPRPHRRSACRQTQNPERGRKPLRSHLAHTVEAPVVRPKTPRGDGNLHPESPYARNASNVSSDPKPREGTETRNPAPHPQLRHAPEVVRPKTPRGDGNSKSSTTSAAAACSRSRQTQNPERGRKLNNTFFERGAVESVVRPKTPRGDGNTETQHQPDNLILASSDPKPREGTETF
ncbi:hypothetical protein N116_02885 [Mycobacterium tuberculosis variant africanum MAL020185]|nr:hypothetical protein N116_02885 [Mycobacterium tuberculosis variant africanum MAL020185]